MLFDEVKQYLSPEERSAIEFLERRGFSILTEARLDDCKKKDGSRFRTFSLQGRYDVMIGLKSVAGRDGFQAEETEESEQSFNDSNSLETDIEAEGGGEDVEEVIGGNFWMNRDRWIMMNRAGFFHLVTEEALADLQAAPVDVQAEVKDKFLRFFDESEWPL
jgi:hypothetical protein